MNSSPKEDVSCLRIRIPQDPESDHIFTPSIKRVKNIQIVCDCLYKICCKCKRPFMKISEEEVS